MANTVAASATTVLIAPPSRRGRPRPTALALGAGAGASTAPEDRDDVAYRCESGVLSSRRSAAKGQFAVGSGGVLIVEQILLRPGAQFPKGRTECFAGLGKSVAHV